MILDKYADIFRLAQDPSDADHEYYQPQIRRFRLNVQPMSDQYEAAAGDTFGRSYRAFTQTSGILIRDKVTISGSTTYSGMEYIVEGIKDWNQPIGIPHYELLLREAGS